jgi:SCF-associated factor 1
MASFIDLPLDILVLIFPYLDAKSFLSLCSTCKAFHSDNVLLDPGYWRYATRSKFRVRNIPVVKNDGFLWQRLYRRMFTQSRVFTWGQNTRGCLGHSFEQREPPPMMSM